MIADAPNLLLMASYALSSRRAFSLPSSGNRESCGYSSRVSSVREIPRSRRGVCPSHSSPKSCLLIW